MSTPAVLFADDNESKLRVRSTIVPCSGHRAVDDLEAASALQAARSQAPAMTLVNEPVRRLIGPAGR